MPDQKHNPPAIEGGSPVRESFLPFFRPSIDSTDVEGVVAALESGWLTLGPVTQQFERALHDYIGARYVVAVNSCTAAMFLAMKALGIGPGDEVVTSALTFASTVESIIHAGAMPVLADIEMETFGVSPEELDRRTTSRTRAYLPVHFGGQACRIGEVMSLARARGVTVIEDAAHSFGAKHAGQNVGTFGDATTFSFYATKNLTTGEGGCIATNDEGLAGEVRSLSCHGMSEDSWARYSDKGSWYYEIDRVGYKFNMSDVLSALGIAQLRRIDHLLDGRRRVAAAYAEHLSGSPYFSLPRTLESNVHTWHLFVVLIETGRLQIGRDEFVRALAAENIGCSVHFIPVYRHPFFEKHTGAATPLPNCEEYFSRCVSLPIFPDMRNEDVLDVVEAMNRIAAYYAKPK